MTHIEYFKLQAKNLFREKTSTFLEGGFDLPLEGA